MHHDQRALLVRHSSGDEMVLIDGMQGVGRRYGKRIEENSCCFSKGDAVLLIIGFGFCWIPFESGVHAETIRNTKVEENPHSGLETFRAALEL